MNFQQLKLVNLNYLFCSESFKIESFKILNNKSENQGKFEYNSWVNNIEVEIFYKSCLHVMEKEISKIWIR